MSGWELVLLEPAKMLLAQIGQFLVNALLVVIILIIGWVISMAVKSLITRLLRAIKLDVLSQRIEIDNILAKGGIRYSLSELLGIVCYWLMILVTFVVAVNAVGLTAAAELLNRVVAYIPDILGAIFILILGMFVGTLLKNVVQTMAVNAGLSQDKFLGKIAEMIVIVFSGVIALEQLKIGTAVLNLTLSLFLGAVGLAIAIAFGLGCKDMAGKFIAELIEKLKNKK